jgi:hypothetical protein
VVAHVAPGTGIVIEPVVPNLWGMDIGHPLPLTSLGYRWMEYPSLRTQIDAAGNLTPEPGPVVNIEDYERTLSPALIGLYEQGGYCWVVSGSTQSGRAAADPTKVPLALAYYQQLAQDATVAFRASPFRAGRSVPFNFDWSFDYYPLAYHDAGPVMTVYRLHGGRCGR